MDYFASCVCYLDQASSVLERLDPSQYSSPHAHCYGGSIGGHIRHCIEHFRSFADGVPSGRIDYDARKRDQEIETDPKAALAEIAAMRRFLSDGARNIEYSTVLTVKVDCGGYCEDEEALWQQSTIGREAQFLVSHTVHHFAIIWIMCRAVGISLEADFGVAPSTLRHRELSA